MPIHPLLGSEEGNQGDAVKGGVERRNVGGEAEREGREERHDVRSVVFGNDVWLGFETRCEWKERKEKGLLSNENVLEETLLSDSRVTKSDLEVLSNLSRKLNMERDVILAKA